MRLTDWVIQGAEDDPENRCRTCGHWPVEVATCAICGCETCEDCGRMVVDLSEPAAGPWHEIHHRPGFGCNDHGRTA